MEEEGHAIQEVFRMEFHSVRLFGLSVIGSVIFGPCWNNQRVDRAVNATTATDRLTSLKTYSAAVNGCLAPGKSIGENTPQSQ
jgi:hypothetical protein